MSRLEEVKQLLEKYDEAYYNKYSSLITDEEYDKLKDEYLSLGGKDFVSGKIINGNKVKHTFHVSSLGKVKVTEKDKLRKEIERLMPVLIQPKFDGMTLVQYENDLVSRGDGEVGESKQDKKKYINGIGKYFGKPVRGEALMLKSDFEKINKELEDNGEELLSNTRNAISGMLNRKNITPKGISFFAYYVDGIDNPVDQITTLQENGYNVAESYIPETVDEAIKYIETFDRNSLPYDIDGLVVKHIGDKKFGETEHHPLNAIAVKFETESKFTELIDIEWNVGKTGLVSPVAIFKPVDIMGSTVERATLHNWEYIQALGINFIYSDLYHRTLVEVTKSNEVIPRVLSCKHEIANGYSKIDGYYKNVIKPTTCPICGSKLEDVNGLLYCRNEHCREKVIAQAEHLVSRDALDIRGLSSETIQKMYDYDLLYVHEADYIDFTLPLQFTYEQILELEGFAEKSAKKLADEIKKKTSNVKFSKFLNACNIPLLGKTASKLIAKKFKSLDELKEDVLCNNGKLLTSIDGIGDELYKSIYNNFNNIFILNGFINNIEYEYKEENKSKVKQLTFVITGSFDKPRSYYQELIESKGHKVSGSVSKNTYCVMIGSDAGSKETKARELIAKGVDIKIATNEEELLSVLNTVN